jgi:hypothetical protein
MLLELLAQWGKLSILEKQEFLTFYQNCVTEEEKESQTFPRQKLRKSSGETPHLLGRSKGHK